MNNLLKLIGKYSNFLIFIILEVVAFLLIGNYNDYPHSKFLSSSNAIVGWQYEKVTNVRNFFALRSINEKLVQENAALRSALSIQEDSLCFDMLTNTPIYLPAKVVGITLHESHNYLTINRGEEDGVCVGQGVRNEEGVVGIISTVNTHYSVVLPIINSESNLSCRFLKNDYLATLKWKGANPDYATLEDVAAHIPVREGDTIVTSGLTSSFPEGVRVGVVSKVKLQKGDSYYSIDVKLATDFRKIKYVEIIGEKQETILPEIVQDGVE